MKKYKSLFIGLLSILLLGCSQETDNSYNPTSEPTESVNTITDINLELISEDKAKNTALIHITAKAKNAIAVKIYDNEKEISLDSGTVEDGYITLASGVHNIQACAGTQDDRKCSLLVPLLVSENLSLSSYEKVLSIDESNSLTNNGTNLIYGTSIGELYSLNLTNQENTLLYNTHTRVSGLVYVSEGEFYYSSVDTSKVSYLDIDKYQDYKITSITFPDGLDLYNNELYVVEDDVSGELSVFSTNGVKQRDIYTGIDDITGITHTEKYLYILSEDGEIYQTNASTGKSSKIFTNDNFFSKGNSANGLEGITILNNKIYVVYIDDKSIYKINIDIKKYE